MSLKELTARLSAARKVRARNAFIVAAAENEELATASCGFNLYPKHMAMSSKKFYLRIPPLQINMALIYHI